MCQNLKSHSKSNLKLTFQIAKLMMVNVVFVTFHDIIGIILWVLYISIIKFFL